MCSCFLEIKSLTCVKASLSVVILVKVAGIKSRLPSSTAARILVALAGPTPPILHKSLMEVERSETPAISFLARVKALYFELPVLIKMASNSAVVRFCAPVVVSFSLGL